MKNSSKLKKNERNGTKRELNEKSEVVLHNNIPQDIVLEILSRLPIKSIIRFKAVSKLWHSTISNPNFRICRPATRIFAVEVKYENLLLYSIDENGSIEKFQPSWSKYLVYDRLRDHVVCSNSCNGKLLLCFGRLIFLVNPTTRYTDRVLMLDERYDDKDKFFEMGFCYDKSIDDYKAVIVPTKFTLGMYAIVASLKGKKWTVLRIPTIFYGTTLGPFVNDRLHATACVNRSDHFNTIVFFNPIKDVFEKLPCPRPKSGDEDVILGLGVLEDFLCMVRSIHVKDSTGDVEVLKMKEYGVEESWTSLFVLRNVCVYRFDQKINPFLRTDDGDILIKSNANNIWRYNLANKSYREFKRNGCNYFLHVVPFVENLYSPVLEFL